MQTAVQGETFVRRLYDLTIGVDRRRFRLEALALLREIIDYDAAIWTRSLDGCPRLDEVTVLGLDQDFIPGFSRIVGKHDPPPSAEKRLGAVHAGAAMPGGNESAGAIGRLYAAYGIREHMSYVCANSTVGVIDRLVLYRFAEDKPFSEQDMAALQRVGSFLPHAAMHAFFIQESKPTDRYWNRPSGICDESGRLFQADAALLTLLKNAFPGWAGRVLPFGLPLARTQGEFSQGPVTVYFRPMGDLFLVRVWARDPAEVLSKRERQVARLVLNSHTFKAAARRLDISPSTAANHFYATYKKLGVTTRSEVADILANSAD